MKLVGLLALVAVSQACPNGLYGPQCDVDELCAHPQGTDCSFYLKCFDAHVQCEVTEKIAAPKCEEYQTIEPKLSSDGQSWSQYVRKCLQQTMANAILIPSGNAFTCDVIQESFFRDHLPCYTEGPLSFCTLPLSDSVRVLWHAKDIMWSGYLHESTEAGVKLMAVCGMQAFTFDPENPEDVFSNFNDFAMKKEASTEGTPALGSARITLEQFQQQLNTVLSTYGWEVSVVKADETIVIGIRKLPDASNSHFSEAFIRSLINEALATLIGADSVPKFNLNAKPAAGSVVTFQGHTWIAVGVVASVGAVGVALGAAVMARRERKVYEHSQVF